MTSSHDPILAADIAEEEAAATALRKAATKDEHASVWWRSADHFEGPARARLQDVYADALLQFVPMGMAG